MSSPHVDWSLAERVAKRVARRVPVPDDAIDAGSIGPMVAFAEERVAAVTGLRSLAGPARVQIIGRDEWVAANIAGFRRLLTPVLDGWWERSQRRGRIGSGIRSRFDVAAAASRVAAIELGALLGWMSTRVLGQYDVLVADSGPSGDPSGDGVYLVGPNIVGLEQRYGFAADEFRLWVTAHELTHRAQFTGVPWMRAHFLALVDDSLKLADTDPATLLLALREALRDRAQTRQRMAEGGIVAVVANDEQRAVLGQITGMMALLEGHGDVTMDRAVADRVPSAERFAAVLRARRTQANPLVRLIQRLSGLEAKLGQYAAGERFIAEVEAAAGMRAVDVCWREAANLPTFDEVRTPRLWLDRVGGLLAARA